MINVPQAQGLQRAMNVSQTISQTHDQASLYIPLSLDLDHLPQYINLDENSSWHTAAILGAVVETVSLPSRLLKCRPRRGYMNDMDSTINVNGNQNIADCQASIVNPKAWEPNGTPLTGAASDVRIPTADGTSRLLDSEDMRQAALQLDMDFLPPDGSSRQRELGKEHVFARVDTLRGYLEDPDAVIDEDVGEARKRQRTANLPITEKSVPILQITNATLLLHCMFQR